MRRMRVVGFGSVVVALAACSSGSPTVAEPTASGGAPPGKTLAYFEGTVDVAHGTMDVVARGPSGGLSPQVVTLPYGTSSGDVYFHTCSTTAPTTTYGGGVTAINLSTGTVTNLNAVIDSISETGVTLATGSGAGGTTGIIASYGTVAPNAQNCTTPTTWTFNIPGASSFTFSGHASGYADGLVADWAVNEGSGTTFNDSSGNAQTATASGGSWMTGGYDGPAVTNTALPLTTTGVTISLMAKRLGTGTGGYPRIISLDTTSLNGLEIADNTGGGGTLAVWNANAGWVNTGAALPASFVHIVVTANSSAMLVYVGGTLVSTLAGTSQDFTGFPLYFGQRGAGAGEDFDGIYSDVRVFNRVLSATEVAALP